MVINNLDIINFKAEAIAAPRHKAVKAIDSIRRECVTRYRIHIGLAIGFDQIHLHRVRCVDFVIRP